MTELGVPLASEKTQGPTEVLVFLGLELDTNQMTIRIPSEKVEEINVICCYKTHSFIICRATDLAIMGVTAKAIMKAGRWNSDCYKLYIR
jgi:hypothetical protein